MTDELFNIPETLSPRLAWMRDNGITVGHPTNSDVWVAVKMDGCRIINGAQADTQDEALDALASKLNIKPWRL